jgi:hypothetical protein
MKTAPSSLQFFIFVLYFEYHWIIWVNRKLCLPLSIHCSLRDISSWKLWKCTTWSRLNLFRTLSCLTFHSLHTCCWARAVCITLLLCRLPLVMDLPLIVSVQNYYHCNLPIRLWILWHINELFSHFLVKYGVLFIDKHKLAMNTCVAPRINNYIIFF